MCEWRWNLTTIQTGLRTQGVLQIKDNPSKIRMGPRPKSVVPLIKLYMLSYRPVSHKCSNFWYRHHALDAHTPNFHSADISRFPIFSNQNFLCLWFISLSLFPIWFRQDVQISSRPGGKSEICHYVVMQNERKRPMNYEFILQAPPNLHPFVLEV